MKNQKAEAAMPFEKVVDELFRLSHWVGSLLEEKQREADKAREVFRKAIIAFATERRAKALCDAAMDYALKAKRLNDCIEDIKAEAARLPDYPKACVEKRLQAHLDCEATHDSDLARADFQRLFPLLATTESDEEKWLIEGMESITFKTYEEVVAAKQKGFLGWDALYKRYTQQW